MKKYFIILFLGIYSSQLASAQTPIFTVLEGSNHVIKAGTVISMDGLVMTPSKDFSFSGKNLTRKSTATNTTTNPNINNYYAFNGTTNSYTGDVKFNYSDADLNGLKESDLKLNVFIPSTWDLQKTGSINTTDNFTQNTLSGVLIKELTLGYIACIPTSVMATNTAQTICTGNNISNINITDAHNATGTTFTWTRNNTSLVTGIASSGTGASISGSLVNATTTPQTTVFIITANRPNGCATTTMATITVNPKPSIISQPASTAKLTTTQTAVFSVNVAGPVTSYQWQQLNTSNNAVWVNINSGGFYAGENSNTLTLSTLSLSMNGYKYRCIVKGPCTAPLTSNAATLYVTINSNANIATFATPNYINVIEGNNAIKLMAYPNPTYGQFNLEVTNFEIAKATLRIADILGNVMMVKDVEITSIKQILPLSLNNPIEGVYIVQVFQSGRAASLMVVKK